MSTARNSYSHLKDLNCNKKAALTIFGTLLFVIAAFDFHQYDSLSKPEKVLSYCNTTYNL
jgi:hypothetical protein